MQRVIREIQSMKADIDKHPNNTMNLMGFQMLLTKHKVALDAAMKDPVTAFKLTYLCTACIDKLERKNISGFVTFILGEEDLNFSLLANVQHALEQRKEQEQKQGVRSPSPFPSLRESITAVNMSGPDEKKHVDEFTHLQSQLLNMQGMAPPVRPKPIAVGSSQMKISRDLNSALPPSTVLTESNSPSSPETPGSRVESKSRASTESDSPRTPESRGSPVSPVSPKSPESSTSPPPTTTSTPLSPSPPLSPRRR